MMGQPARVAAPDSPAFLIENHLCDTASIENIDCEHFREREFLEILAELSCDKLDFYSSFV